MQITSITVENFRSFGKVQTISLGKLTLLVGPNNAGKSNALEALNAVKMFITSPQDSMSDMNRYRRANVSDYSLAVGFTSNAATGSYRTRIDSESFDEQFTNSEGSFANRNGKISGSWLNGRAGSQTSGLWQIQQGNPAIHEFVSFLQSYEIRRALPECLDASSPVQRLPIVGPNGQHAAAVLDHLRDRFPDRYASIQDDLRRCAPEFDRVVAEADDQQGQKEIWFYERSGASFRCRQVSEGLKFLLFVLMILHSPSPPRIFALEEVEHGLHPRRLRDVIGFLRQLTNRPDGPQIILTTHSPYVLDQFRDTPQDVVIVERDEGRSTVCISLAERLKSVHDKDAPLGEIWYQGLVGGVPPT